MIFFVFVLQIFQMGDSSNGQRVWAHALVGTWFQTYGKL